MARTSKSFAGESCGFRSFPSLTLGGGDSALIRRSESPLDLPRMFSLWAIVLLGAVVAATWFWREDRDSLAENSLSGLSACVGLNPERPRAASPPEAKPLVLVVYYSRSGNTEKMAQAVAEGASQLEEVQVLLRKITEVTAQELTAADAIALGCPTYFANIPGEMKQHLDLWNWKWRVDFTDKIGGAFATGGGQMGGKEHTMTSLLLFMLANRMIVAGPLFEDETGEDIWGEPGAGAMTGPLDPGISPGELESARRLGYRLATLAVRWKNRSPQR
jgi:NAD(P)H dehydrogenase (quinone)